MFILPLGLLNQIFQDGLKQCRCLFVVLEKRLFADIICLGIKIKKKDVQVLHRDLYCAEKDKVGLLFSSFFMKTHVHVYN